MTSVDLAVRARPHLGPARFLALAILGVLVAHDGVFIVQYGIGAGYEAAMARTTHGYWPAFMAFTGLVGFAGILAAARALSRLSRTVRGLPAGGPGATKPAYWNEFRHLWPRLFAVVLIGFVVQENIEHVLAGAGLPGLWVLSAPDYPLSIPAIIVVSTLLAAASSWITWRREILIERLRAARAAARGRPRHTATTPHGRWALLAALLANRWATLRRDAERAPPVPAAA